MIPHTAIWIWTRPVVFTTHVLLIGFSILHSVKTYHYALFFSYRFCHILLLLCHSHYCSLHNVRRAQIFPDFAKLSRQASITNNSVSSHPFALKLCSGFRNGRAVCLERVIHVYSVFCYKLCMFRCFCMLWAIKSLLYINYCSEYLLIGAVRSSICPLNNPHKKTRTFTASCHRQVLIGTHWLWRNSLPFFVNVLYEISYRMPQRLQDHSRRHYYWDSKLAVTHQTYILGYKSTKIAIKLDIPLQVV